VSFLTNLYKSRRPRSPKSPSHILVICDNQPYFPIKRLETLSVATFEDSETSIHSITIVSHQSLNFKRQSLAFCHLMSPQKLQLVQ